MRSAFDATLLLAAAAKASSRPFHTAQLHSCTAQLHSGKPACKANLWLILRTCTQTHTYKHHSSGLWLTAASTGLLAHMRSPLVGQMARMLRDIDATDDAVDAISELLQVHLCGLSTICLVLCV